MSHQQTYAACCLTSILMLFVPSDVEASQWHSSIPAKLFDQIDPINLIFTLDEQRLDYGSMSGKFLSAKVAENTLVTSSLAPLSTESHLLYPQTDQAIFSNIQVQYLHTDLLGSVVLETDSNGNAIKTTTYKPFGESVNY